MQVKREQPELGNAKAGVVLCIIGIVLCGFTFVACALCLGLFSLAL